MNFLHLHLTYSIEPKLHNIIFVIWAPSICSPACSVIAFPSLLFLTIYNYLNTLNLTGIPIYSCAMPSVWNDLHFGQLENTYTFSKSNSSDICFGTFSLPFPGDVEDSFPILPGIFYTTLSFIIIITTIIIILCWICLFPDYLYTIKQFPLE